MASIPSPGGVLLVAKPAGVTSHDVVERVRRLPVARGAKVGHAGTLDPFATGLLLVLIGQATRFQRFFMSLPKTYEAVARLGAVLKENGFSMNAVPVRSPKINGVVTDVRTIAGRPYATISVGSVDNVVKGMQFNVIDRDSGNFLGILTVDTVEPNESTGQLQGPRVADIHKGHEVRTQL